MSVVGSDISSGQACLGSLAKAGVKEDVKRAIREVSDAQFITKSVLKF